MELVAKGWSALQEVDRVIDFADRNDKRLIPLLRVQLWIHVPSLPPFGTTLLLGFNFLLCDSFSVSKGAKENFELALEIDNMNTHARCWLAKMHFKYHVPGACKAM